eukprot:gnl/Chilomastix_cuspidata/7677.p1 GENE.gnl/Chilomastix_cuspidata/7677~~gnl/Chilomastix_cuspidata/7677.p1  ORF type:complete len:281 (+),score=86.37 gnl/Chilomastix_cuspidata/7677:231-1073(+)
MYRRPISRTVSFVSFRISGAMDTRALGFGDAGALFAPPFNIGLFNVPSLSSSSYSFTPDSSFGSQSLPQPPQQAQSFSTTRDTDDSRDTPSADSRLEPLRRERHRWTQDEFALLARLVATHGEDWHTVSAHLPGTTPRQCRDRWASREAQGGCRTGFWSKEETARLFALQQTLGNKWTAIAREMKTRSPSQCKGHYNHVLRNYRRKPRNTSARPPRPVSEHPSPPISKRPGAPSLKLHIDKSFVDGLNNLIEGANLLSVAEVAEPLRVVRTFLARHAVRD